MRSSYEHATITKTLALLVLGSLAPVVLLLAAFTFLLARDEDSARQEQLQREAEQVAEDVDKKLAKVIATLNVLGRSAFLTQRDFAQFYGLSRAVLDADDDVSNLMLVSAEGDHLVNLRLPYGAALPPLRRPDLPRTAASERRAVVSDSETGIVTGQSLTGIYVPVEQDGQVKYVIAAAVEVSRWNSILRERPSPGVHRALLNAQGRAISTSYDSADEPSHLQAGDAAYATPGGGMVLRSVPSRLQKFSKTSEPAGWTVLSYVPPAEAHSLVLPYALAVFAAFSVATLSALFIAVRLGRSTGASIRGLVESVKTVAGEGTPQPIHTRILEVAEAQKALDDTAKSLALRVSEANAAKAELQKINDSKMDFLAALGHELRNPLGAIRNALQVAQRTSDPERVKWAHRIIDSQSTQMTKLVGDLFDVSRVDRGKLTLSLEPLELSALVMRVAEDTREEFANRNLLLDVHVEPVQVRGDEVRLVQVLSNLLHNAIKFTPRGGKVLIRLDLEGQLARLRVTDTGEGISADSLATIFQPFLQGRNVSKEGGLGLGLALVQRLVELHDGSVVAESAGTGQGATFTVKLPSLGGLPTAGFVTPSTGSLPTTG